MSKDTGGPAFPSSNEVRVGDFRTNGHSGMTLRDYFAAKALVAAMAQEGMGTITRGFNYNSVATMSYRMADAMIKAREVQND